MDSHVHTQMAYCSENMDLISSLRLAKLWGLEKIAFTEHSGHLYFKREQYWGENKIWYQEGLDCADGRISGALCRSGAGKLLPRHGTGCGPQRAFRRNAGCPEPAGTESRGSSCPVGGKRAGNERRTIFLCRQISDRIRN